ncbi:MAG: hypothetical protein ABSB83_05940 [Methanomassiliicoccales archaeon]
MSVELDKVRLHGSSLEVRYITDEYGWHALLCEDGLCCLANEGDDERLPSRTCGISMAEVLLRRHLNKSDILPLDLVEEGEVYSVDVP